MVPHMEAQKKILELEERVRDLNILLDLAIEDREELRSQLKVVTRMLGQPDLHIA